MQYFVLYGTLGCHLCEQAEALLAPLLDSEKHCVECIDISEDDELMSRYALTIPVLRRMSDRVELKWPFDAARAEMFLSPLS
jgi:hypothetical protein